ncbi:hypothetical protein M758_5G185200 [Ceratodon purpureus]|uniref:Activator of Hsp90 ATPase AHSA1-like N-terminal domain-containing protein n=1 Tax=Ceratodon purpureus TaxID=3225 RepID=A0A8T0I383_CERPU|nr:hypothetical protein KC19_5G192400 [Ceratodon purpureus]KAG0617375.1 hypothetical protein M758_5G185200 [Ceratodon purpureus]
MAEAEAEVKMESAAAAVEGGLGDAELKKKTSYRYWVRGGMADAAPRAVPQKLTEEEVVANANGNGKGMGVGSAWNQAGTWEEKVLSSWAWSRVKELLPSVEPVELEDGTARVKEVTSCSGDASMVMVRQRKRIGYTFEIEMKYAMDVGAGEERREIEGKMKVPEACYGELDDLELEVTVSAKDVKDSAKRTKVKQTLTKMFLPRIRRKLEEFEAELKER